MRKWAGLVVGVIGLVWTGTGIAQINPPVTQCTTQALAGGTGDVLTIPALPCVPTTTLLLLTISASNTTTTPTLQPVGVPAQTIVSITGGPLAIGELVVGATEILINTGVVWKKLNSSGGTITSITANNGLTANPNPITVGSATIGLALIPSNTVLGNVSVSDALPVPLTKPQLTTLINVFGDSLSGAVPASGGGTTNFLRADGTWTIPTGTGCSPSGAGGILLNNGSNSCVTDTSIVASAGALSLGGSGNPGSILMGNASSGVGVLGPTSGALGSVLWSLPAANTDVPVYSQFVTYTGMTAARTVTYADANFTAAALDLANQTISGGFHVTANNIGTVSSGTLTVSCGTRDLQYFTNNGAFTLAADSSDGSCAYLMTNGASAGAVTLSGFTLVGGVCDGAALDTVNAHMFKLYFTRINGISDCAVKAYQ